MLKLCQRCYSRLKEGQRVGFCGEGTYHELKSDVSFAIDKEDLVVEPDSLVHAQGSDCNYENAY